MDAPKCCVYRRRSNLGLPSTAAGHPGCPKVGGILHGIVPGGEKPKKDAKLPQAVPLLYILPTPQRQRYGTPLRAAPPPLPVTTKTAAAPGPKDGIHSTTAWTSTYPTPRPRRPCTPSNAKRPDVVSAPAQSLSHTWALLNDAIALASSAPWPLGRCLPATVLSAARPNRLPARPRLDTDRSRTLVHRTPPGRRDLRLGEANREPSGSATRGALADRKRLPSSQFIGRVLVLLRGTEYSVSSFETPNRPSYKERRGRDVAVVLVRHHFVPDARHSRVREAAMPAPCTARSDSFDDEVTSRIAGRATANAIITFAEPPPCGLLLCCFFCFRGEHRATLPAPSAQCRSTCGCDEGFLAPRPRRWVSVHLDEVPGLARPASCSDVDDRGSCTCRLRERLARNPVSKSLSDRLIDGDGSDGEFENSNTAIMADEYNAEEAAELKKRRAFRKFSYRGIDLDNLLDLSSDQLRDVVHARARRRINRGLKRRPMGLIKKLRKAKQEAKPNEKPDLVKTHLRDMIVVPEMIGSVIGIYSGKEFNQVEIKPEMVGHYLAEFSISYPSSTADPVSVPRTLLVSFPSSKKVVVSGGFCIHGHVTGEKDWAWQGGDAPANVSDDNGYHDSTIRSIVLFSSQLLVPWLLPVSGDASSLKSIGCAHSNDEHTRLVSFASRLSGNVQRGH
ncbi:40S ribosomal protein S15 [Purpureocillium lilacinum]|uniref:40S ribosomal protein S15 n=1 Tax=Purpureocillium lilacinum TaxID=33203 RepID=A0A2U3EIH2_PURLI|nr:40S ribosomal protein S15 [Purpureocillium lilacinum]